MSTQSSACFVGGCWCKWLLFDARAVKSRYRHLDKIWIPSFLTTFDALPLSEWQLVAQGRNGKQGSSGVCLNKSLDVRHFSSFKTPLTVTLLIQLPDSGPPWRRCQPGSPIYVCQKSETIPRETLNSASLVIKVNQYQVCSGLVTFEPSVFRFCPGSPNVLTAQSDPVQK